MRYKLSNKLIIAGALILVILGMQLLGGSDTLKEEQIIEAFAKGQYISNSSSVEAVVNYGNRYLNDEKKKEFLEDLAKQIGLNSTYEYNVERNTSGETATIQKTAKNADTLIKLVSIENKGEDNVIELEQYIIVNITFKNSVDNAITYKEKLEDIFKKLNLEPETTINLTGVYDGQLSDESRDAIVKSLLDDINADIITQNEADNIYNIYAYTKLIDDYMIVEDKQVNVNLAVTYNEIENTTNINLSSPIITTDY